MARVVSIVCLLALLSLAVGQEPPKQYFCGRRLAEALSLICENGLMLEKRGDEIDALDDEAGWPWAERGKRRRWGVVDECCKNPCSKDQLMNYCMPLEVSKDSLKNLLL